jgi:hypothetical protein
MHQRIDTALCALRQDLQRHLKRDWVVDACRKVGHRWRACTLNPVAIFHWFMTQILHGNTSLAHISLLAGRAFTDEAYCQARARLPLPVFEAVLRRVADALIPRTRGDGLWRGHRVVFGDGSGASTPDTPELQACLGQPSNQARGCGFPVMRFLALFHFGTGMLLQVVAAALRTHDLRMMHGALDALEPNDVLVGDRGFCSFAHLAMLAQRGVHGVFRVHQKQIVDFIPRRKHARQGDKKAAKGQPRSRWLRRLGKNDQLVEWPKPRESPAWLCAEEYAALPAVLVLRELCYQIARAGFRTRTVTLVTTLCDAELYPLEALAELYAARWDVEVNFRHLKQSMKMDVLKCKSVDGIIKELHIYALIYNLARLVMCEASARQSVPADRISFMDAYRWLCQANENVEVPALVINQKRPGRVEPRVRKRRPKPYPLMKKPRHVLRKQLITQAVDYASSCGLA